MKKTQRRHLGIIGLLGGLLALPFGIFAQEEVPLASWTGTETSGIYTLDSDITLTGTVVLTGNLTINAGGDAHTIKKGDFNGYMFRIPNGKSLTITGTSTEQITIDGGVVWSTPNDATSELVYREKNGAAFRIIGELFLEQVIVQNFPQHIREPSL